MNWPAPLRHARFLRRENRFRAQVLLDGRAVAAHVPNSGRLAELLTPSARVWILPAGESKRKTVCDLVLAEQTGTLVAVDARLPNALVTEALAAGSLPPFVDYSQVQAEVRIGKSRLDFLLQRDPLAAQVTATANPGPVTEALAQCRQRCWLEVKSVTLVDNGVALFPDAPTTRGLRHLQELQQLRRCGDRAAVVFVVQRQDAVAFSPHLVAHPEFAAALRRAQQNGVEVHAWRCAVTLEGSRLTDAIPTWL